MGRPYAEVIGDPIAHSKSPLIHNFWLAKLGIDAEYRATRVTRDDLPAYFSSRRADMAWKGCNVTRPHKAAAMAHVFHYGPDVERIGALNTVRRSGWEIIGFNTDTNGVCQALYRGGDLNGAEQVCLIGAGGAARAAMEELGGFGVKNVNVIARSLDSARQLLLDFDQAGSIGAFEQAGSLIGGSSALINASPLGMAGYEPMPDAVLDSVKLLRQDAFVFDMVYSPLETALLSQARALELGAIDGLVMLLSQAASAFQELFNPSRFPDWEDAELRAFIIAQ